MLEWIVPEGVEAIETRIDFSDDALFPAERALVAQAVEKRRREFTAGRVCARRALDRLGVEPAPLLVGRRGEPLWPDGIVGSITHCDGYRACAVAAEDDFDAIGIDAEPNRALPDGILPDIAGAAERAQVEQLLGEAPAVHWDRLLFCAKEAVYKVWHPLARSWLGFEDAVVRIGPGGTFAAELLVEGPRHRGRPLEGFAGRWLAHEGLLLAALALPR